MVTLVNRAKVTTATTGTGTITLGSAEGGYQSFADAGVSDGDVVRYTIEDGTAWEIGTGTYTASGTTLTRTVLESSNADAALNLTGSAVVYVSATDADFREETVGTITSSTLDLSSGNVFSYTPTADTTFVFNNPPASGTAQGFTLKVTGVSIDNAWDLANAQPPAYGKFSVAAQDTNPQDFFFKPDGLKMYVLGGSGDDVNEYDLSTAWDISTATFLQNFSINAQEINPQGVFFGDNGTKMYVTGQAGGDVNEYTLSTAWDISTASYIQNFSVATQEPNPAGLFFKPDGTKMYTIGVYGLNEYTLSTAWDISTASYIQNFSVAAQETTPQGVFFKPDGTKMYVIGQSGDDVNEYTLSTAWDISTASYIQNFSINAQDKDPAGLFFKPDGLKMYVLGSEGDDVNAYTLSTAWDVSTASFDLPTEGYFSVAAQETGPQGVFFKPGGTKMYVIGFTGDAVNEYDLSTAWDISTATFLQNFSVSSQDGTPTGVFFKPDGLKMYVIGNSGDDVNEYTLSTAWDITTASYLQNFSVATQETNPTGLSFKPDGTKMYVIGLAGDDVNEYDLSTAWDVSTASYLQNFSIATQEGLPQDLFFKSDGLKMYVIGNSGDDVNEYDLSTAWDVSTATFLQNFSVATEVIDPTSVFFGDNGTKMYITNQSGAAVWQYSTGTFDPATFTYPASVAWPAATAPDAPADGEVDTLEFLTIDGGVTYYGRLTGNAYS